MEYELSKTCSSPTNGVQKSSRLQVILNTFIFGMWIQSSGWEGDFYAMIECFAFLKYF